MSQSELERLEAEEAALRAKLNKLRESKQVILKREAEEKAERERQELLKKHVTVQITRVDGGNIFCESEYRPDLVELWKQIPGRIFQGYRGGDEKGIGVNGIPLKEWESTKEKLLKLPFVEIEWADGVEELYEWYMNAPPLEVDFNHERQEFLLIPGPGITINIYSIPGYERNYDFGGRTTFTVPSNEGWRIPEATKGIDGVVYSDAASNKILSQIQQRTKLDEIALKEDSDFIKEINGFPLRKFQRVGVEFLYESNGRTILADDTGLGKTWQSLAYAEKRREEKEGFQTICIVKAANILNWRREIEKLTSETPYQCFTGKPNAYDAQQIMLKRKPYVLISYDTMAAYRVMRDDVEIPKNESREGAKLVFPWVELFNLSNPDLLIFDEAHQIKNPEAYRTKAAFSLEDPPHVLALTATPILNRTEELGSILRLVQPGLFKSHEAFKRGYTINGRQPRNTKELHRMMRTFFLRRHKKDVMQDFPQINRMQRFHDLSNEALQSYNEVLLGLYTQLAEYDPSGVGGQQMGIMSILATITRLTQICAADKAKSSTPELAKEIADAANGEIGEKKILIGTHFKGTAWNIAQRLGDEAVCTVKNLGHRFNSMNADERDYLFEETRHNDNIKYVVTTEATKEGANLEYCWWVIFNDPWWTPMAHYQFEGRCIRVSNPHSIDSYYNVADVEVELSRLRLLAEKLKITDKVIEGVESNRDLLGSVGGELIKRLQETMWQKAEQNA